MTEDRASTLALQVLAWLVAQDELLPVFLGASGAGLDDLRAGAGNPALQGAVLDFVLMDDAWVTSCAGAIAAGDGDLAVARQMLPGGALPNWT